MLAEDEVMIIYFSKTVSEPTTSATNGEGNHLAPNQQDLRPRFEARMKNLRAAFVSVAAIIPASIIYPNFIPIPPSYWDLVAWNIMHLCLWGLTCMIIQLVFYRRRQTRLRWLWIPGGLVLCIPLFINVLGTFAPAHSCLSRPNVYQRARCANQRAVGYAESIRMALVAYAANHVDLSFPGSIADWDTLQAISDYNGVAIGPKDKGEHRSLRRYTPIDIDRDGIYEDYTMSFHVKGIPGQSTDLLMLVSPRGIDKKRLASR